MDHIWSRYRIIKVVASVWKEVPDSTHKYTPHRARWQLWGSGESIGVIARGDGSIRHGDGGDCHDTIAA